VVASKERISVIELIYKIVTHYCKKLVYDLKNKSVKANKNNYRHISSDSYSYLFSQPFGEAFTRFNETDKT